ncbi:MAG: polyprenyl synthetase family protein [Thermacetogeniaceae bacterium]
MSWEQELSAKAAMINEALDRCLPDAESYPASIHQAMRYSIFAGGKRLRGALVLAAAEALGRPQPPLLPAAAALEMIHTYSLVHDDLPAMDNDDLRRGKPTCHRVYGEAMAILAGDALLTLAFATLCSLQLAGFDAGAVAKVIGEVASAAGTDGLIGGQVVDLESEGRAIDRQQLEYIHLHKTAALFAAALRTGAILAGAEQQDLQALTEFGLSFGLAFQITDDILDLTGDEALLGKPLNSDLVNQKATYPALYGLEQARRLAAVQMNMALQSIDRLGAGAAFMIGATQHLLNRQS